MAYAAAHTPSITTTFETIVVGARRLADDLGNLEAAINVFHQHMLGGGAPLSPSPAGGPIPVQDDGAVGRMNRQITDMLDRVGYIRGKVNDLNDLFPS